MQYSFLRYLQMCFLASALMISNAASAERCDIIQTFNNESGALDLFEYEFNATPGGSQSLKQKVTLDNKCQPSFIDFRTPNSMPAASTASSFVSRQIDVTTETLSSSLTRSFVTRFRIDPPIATSGSGNLELTYREIEFSPPLGNGDTIPGKASFKLISGDGGKNWTSVVVWNRTINHVTYSHYIASWINSLHIPSQKFEMTVDFTETWQPFPSKWIPKLKISYFRYGENTPFSGELVDMVEGMRPIRQTQGLIGQIGAMAGRKFETINCEPAQPCVGKSSK